MIFIVKNIRLEEHSYLYLLIFDTDCFLNLETVAQNLRLGKNVQIGIDQKSIWVTSQNGSLMGESLWQKDSLVTLILFELGLFWYLAQSQILGNSL